MARQNPWTPASGRPSVATPGRECPVLGRVSALGSSTSQSASEIRPPAGLRDGDLKGDGVQLDAANDQLCTELVGPDAQSIDAELQPILRRAAAGEPQAWRELVDRYSRRIFALAKSRLRVTGYGSAGQSASGAGIELAEEITQSVFATVSIKLISGQYAEQGRFEPWLFRVAINRIRDEIRRQRRHAVVTDPEVLADRAAAVETRNTDAGQLSSLRRAMACLGEADRQVIELRHHAGLSFAQMADMLSEPLGTLLARHHRALRKLRSILENPGELGQRSAGETEDDFDDLGASA